MGLHDVPSDTLNYWIIKHVALKLFFPPVYLSESLSNCCDVYRAPPPCSTKKVQPVLVPLHSQLLSKLCACFEDEKKQLHCTHHSH